MFVWLFVCLFVCCSGYSTHPYELLQVPSLESITTPTSFSSDHTPSSHAPFRQGSSQHTSLSTVRKMVTFDPDGKDEDLDSNKQSNSTESDNGKKAHHEENNPPVKQTQSPHVASPPASSTPQQQPQSVNTDTSSKPRQPDGENDGGLAHTSSSVSMDLHSKSFSPLLAYQHFTPATQSVLLSSKDSSSTIRPEFSSKEEEFIAGLTASEEIRIKSGMAMIKELFLPPPPLVDISNIVTPSSTVASLNAPSSRSSLKSPSQHQRREGKSPVVVLEGEGGGASSKRRSPKRRVTVAGSQISINKSKEKLLQPKREKYCLPGTVRTHALQTPRPLSL